MDMREKLKYLLNNLGLLFISNFSSKILVFILVPFYTSILSSEEYGIYDLAYTTVQLLLPILTLNVLDVVMRFSVDACLEKKIKTISIAVKFLLISVSILVVSLVISYHILNIEIIKNYSIQFFVLYFTYCVNHLASQFARGIEDIKGIAISGVIGTIALISFNVVFLVLVNIGLKGYFYANIVALLMPTVFLFFRNKMWNYFNFRSRDRKYEKEILSYSIPLIFTELSWHINNAADRYAITWMCGLSASGIYSVAYKIPAILNSLQGVFIGAWQLSGLKEYGTEEGNNFIRRTYKGCQSGMVILCSIMIILTNFLCTLLFKKDFFDARYYVPTLLPYVVFNMLSGTVGVVFSAVKDTKAFAYSAITGSLINLVLNVILVYIWGPEGAAIATVVSSLVIWVMRLLYARKYIDLKINVFVTFIQFAILGIQAALMTLVQGWFLYPLQIILTIILIAISYTEVKAIFERQKKNKMRGDQL